MAKLRGAALLLALCGCGSSGNKNEVPLDGSQTDTSGAVGTDGARKDTRPADTGSGRTPDGPPPITSAPPAWERPAECGGIGDTCPEGIFGCSTSSMCQLEGYVCVPQTPKNSEVRPYCMAYTCMSFEEASCFCTGKAAKQYPRCADGPAAVAGLCAGTGASCASKSCCSGLTCVTSSGSALCQRLCTTNADCPSGCCFDKAETGKPICSDASLCASPCAKTGSSCTSSSNCCSGLCVTGTTVSDWVGCRKPCTKDSDCPAGCCELFANSTNGFCPDARWCTCGVSGTVCGSTLPPCCSDQACSKTAAETDYICRPRCKAAEDCPDDAFCSPLTGVDYGVCRKQ